MKKIFCLCLVIAMVTMMMTATYASPYDRNYYTWDGGYTYTYYGNWRHVQSNYRGVLYYFDNDFGSWRPYYFYGPEELEYGHDYHWSPRYYDGDWRGYQWHRDSSGNDWNTPNNAAYVDNTVKSNPGMGGL